MGTMKKEYVSPNINVVATDDLCSNGGIMTASVHQGSLQGERIDQFDVVEKEQTKTDETYSGLWGYSNKNKWGDD